MLVKMMKQIIVDNQVTPYYISNDGECYNSKTDRYLKGQISNSGDDVVSFTNNGIPKKVLQYDLNGVFIREYSSCGDAKRANFPDMKRGTGHIAECCRGKIKQYKGYIWKYKDDIV